jgi:hypothetical protein
LPAWAYFGLSWPPANLSRSSQSDGWAAISVIKTTHAASA